MECSHLFKVADRYGVTMTLAHMLDDPVEVHTDGVEC